MNKVDKKIAIYLYQLDGNWAIWRRKRNKNYHFIKKACKPSQCSFCFPLTSTFPTKNFNILRSCIWGPNYSNFIGKPAKKVIFNIHAFLLLTIVNWRNLHIKRKLYAKFEDMSNNSTAIVQNIISFVIVSKNTALNVFLGDRIFGYLLVPGLMDVGQIAFWTA